jgi:hypothetical protein
MDQNFILLKLQQPVKQSIIASPVRVLCLTFYNFYTSFITLVVGGNLCDQPGVTKYFIDYFWAPIVINIWDYAVGGYLLVEHH